MSSKLKVHNNPHQFKVLVIGDSGTGKTSIIQSYVYNYFTPKHKTTVGVDFHFKELTVRDNVIGLQLWDIAGQDRFGTLSRVYFKEAVGAVIVYDVNKRSTFESVIKWKEELDSKIRLPDGSTIPTILVANKCDIDIYIEVDEIELKKFCLAHNIVSYHITSAKQRLDLDRAFKALVEEILIKNGLIDKQINHQSVVIPDSNSDLANGLTCNCMYL